jgi:hypothetical protein
MRRSDSSTAAAAYLARADLRRRWVQVVALAVLGGLAVGVSLAFLAGARRTDSAYERHLDASNASHVEINPGQYTPESDAAIRSLPGAEDISMWVALTLVRVDDNGEPVPTGEDPLTFTTDGRFYDTDQPVVTAGRLPDPERPNEAAISELAADTSGLSVGDHIDYAWYHYDEETGAPTGDDRPLLRVRIVGTFIPNEDIVPEPLDQIGRAMLSPAMVEKADAIGRLDYPWYGIRVRDGYDGVAAVDRSWRRMAAAHNEGVDDYFQQWSSNIHLTTALRDRSERGVRPLVIALAIFGVLSLLASAGFVAVAAVRLARRPEADLEISRMLGLDRRDLVLAGLAVPLAGVVGAAVVAAATAVLVSPAFPIGPFRAIEPSPGIDVDWLVVGIGSAALLALGGSLAAWSLRRTSSPSVAGATTLHPSRAASWLARSGLPLPMVLGARQALEPGRGRTAVPTRSTLVALMGAVLVLVTAVVFAGNLRDLEADTSRFGWNSDAVAISGSGYDAFIPRRATPWFRENGVARLRYATTGRVVVDGSGVAAVALAAGSDDLGPTVIDGRAPSGPREVALGSETMDDLGLAVGDRVELGSRSRSIQATVTGRAVFPLLGGVQTVHTALGQGAWLNGDDVRLIDDLPEEGSVYNFALLDLRPGVDATELAAAIRTTDDLSSEGGNDVLGVLRPPEVATAVSLDTGQVALAGVLVVIAVLVLGLTLSAVVHRRARDLALHRVLGFTSGQVGAAMSWQSLLTVGVGIAVGLPLGIAAGRWIWTVFADQIHVVPSPTVPVAALAFVVALLVATALAVSVRPALQAARTTPVRWLRAE